MAIRAPDGANNKNNPSLSEFLNFSSHDINKENNYSKTKCLNFSSHVMPCLGVAWRFCPGDAVSGWWSRDVGRVLHYIEHHTGWFFSTGLPCSILKWKKRPTGKPEALLDEGFHGRAALVGSMDFFNFGTEQGGGWQLKNHPVYCDDDWLFNILMIQMTIWMFQGPDLLTKESLERRRLTR